MLNMTHTIGFNVGRSLVTLHGEHSVTFANDLTIEEAKWVIIELLKHGGLLNDDVMTFVNDLARQTLDLPSNCDTLAPTFEERRKATDEALQEIHNMVWGKQEIHY